MKIAMLQGIALRALALSMIAMSTMTATGQLAPEPRSFANAATVQTAPSGIITTVAGDGLSGDWGNGGPANKAQFVYPRSVAVDSAGNLYIADASLAVVRKVTAATGVISAYAGTGEAAYSGDGGPATAAHLDDPSGVAIDSTGDVYIADTRNNVIRRVDAKTGVITTVAGNGYQAGQLGGSYCSTASVGVKATTQPLCFPQAVAVDSAQNIYFSSMERVYKVEAGSGILDLVAGNGQLGYSGDGGLAANATLSAAQGIAVDGQGNVYLADTDNCAIRKVAASTGIITSVIGVPQPSGYDGTCGLAGDGGPAAAARLNYPGGITVDKAGNLFIADSENALIRVVDATTGNIYTIAGKYYTFGTSSYGIAGYFGDGGPATYAGLSYVEGLALDAAGNLYLADSSNVVVRKVTQAAVLPTAAPLIGPVGGTITKATAVTIKSPVKGGVIYYSTDGSIPTTASTRYTGPFNLSQSAIVNSFATIAGKPNTGVTTAVYLYAPSPKISPATANITGPVKITATDSNTKAQIYYTVDHDGGDPRYDATRALYSGPVTISQTTAFKAVAFTSVSDTLGNLYSAYSDVATNNFLRAPSPVVSPGTSTIPGPTVVTMTDAGPWLQLYYTTDGTDPRTFGKTVKGYSGPFTISATTTIKAATWTFSHDGNQKLLSEWSPLTTVTLTLGAAAATPVFTPTGGTYAKAQSVTIKDATAGVTIHYTLDGSDPTASSAVYAGAISITKTTMIKAIATSTKNQPSGIATATYTIAGAVVRRPTRARPE